MQTNLQEQRHEKSRGWFYQAIAPLTTLSAVRGAAQVAHNDIELELLQQKWATKVTIEPQTFEFDNPKTLSWHLTQSEVADIQRAWNEDMLDCRAKVKQYLSGAATA